MIDQRPFLTRLADWFIPNRLRFTPWVFLLSSCFVWTCGNAPYWFSTDFFPLPHPVLLKYAPAFGAISLIITYSFIRKVFYRNLNPLSSWLFYDLTRLEEVWLLLGSTVFGIVAYLVLDSFSSWFWIFNALFAVGLGSLTYILISSRYLILPGEYEPSDDDGIEREPSVCVDDFRGAEPAKMYSSDVWMEGLRTSPSEATIEAAILRQQEEQRDLPPIKQSLMEKVIDWFERWLLNKPTMQPLPIRISSESVEESRSQSEFEYIRDFANEPPPLESWKEPEPETVSLPVEDDDELRFLVKV